MQSCFPDILQAHKYVSIIKEAYRKVSLFNISNGAAGISYARKQKPINRYGYNSLLRHSYGVGRFPSLFIDCAVSDASTRGMGKAHGRGDALKAVAERRWRKALPAASDGSGENVVAAGRMSADSCGYGVDGKRCYGQHG